MRERVETRELEEKREGGCERKCEGGRREGEVRERLVGWRRGRNEEVGERGWMSEHE